MSIVLVLVWVMGSLSIVRGNTGVVGFLEWRDAGSIVFLRRVVEVVIFFVLVFSANEPMPPEDGSNDFLELCLLKSISPSSSNRHHRLFTLLCNSKIKNRNRG